MKHNKKIQLKVEQLEDRWVPTTVKLAGGSLLISNPTVAGNGVAQVTVTATATGLSVTTNGGSTVNVGTVSNIIYTGSLGKDDFHFDAAGQSYNGNLFVNTNNGNDTIQILNGTAGAGKIGGNVTLLTGTGSDSATVAPTNALRILGNLQVVNTLGNDSLNIGAAAALTEAGNVSATGPFVSVTVAPTAADTFAGNVAINDTLAAGASSITVGNTVAAATINGSLTIYGNDSTTVALHGTNATPLSVGGNTQVSLGNNNSQFTSDSVAYSGTFNLFAGNGTDSVTISNGGATFQGNAAFRLGDGDNSFSLGNGFTALGNFVIAAGNGNNGQGNPTLNGAINGSVGLFFGSGDNGGVGDETITVAAAVGGTVYWRSGNGNNQFNLGNGGTNNYIVNAVFGNGDDTFGINTGTGIYDGLADGGGGTNTLNYLSGTPAPTYKQYNF